MKIVVANLFIYINLCHLLYNCFGTHIYCWKIKNKLYICNCIVDGRPSPPFSPIEEMMMADHMGETISGVVGRVDVRQGAYPVFLLSLKCLTAFTGAL